MDTSLGQNALLEHASSLFEFPNRTAEPEYHVGGTVRLATLTDIAWLANDLMVGVHLCGAVLFLLERAHHGSPWQIIDRIDTIFGGSLSIVDLLDVNTEGLIVASNFDACGGSLYRVTNDRLEHVRDLPLPPGAGNCHGARFATQSSVCLTTNRNQLFFHDINANQTNAEHTFPWHVKDMVFTDATHAIAACALGNPTPERQDAYASCVTWLEFDSAHQNLRILDTLFIKPTGF